MAACNGSSRTTSRSVNVGISSHRASISRKIVSVSGRFEFRIASSYDGNSTISMTCVASERSVPTTACVAVLFPLVFSTHSSISRFMSSSRLVLQSMSCTNVMAPPPGPLGPDPSDPFSHRNAGATRPTGARTCAPSAS